MYFMYFYNGELYLFKHRYVVEIGVKLLVGCLLHVKYTQIYRHIWLYTRQQRPHMKEILRIATTMIIRCSASLPVIAINYKRENNHQSNIIVVLVTACNYPKPFNIENARALCPQTLDLRGYVCFQDICRSVGI